MKDEHACKANGQYLGTNCSIQLDKIDACIGPWKTDKYGRCGFKYTCENCGAYYEIDSGD